MKNKMSLIVMAAGDSSRFRQKCGTKKIWLRIGEDSAKKPLWLSVADNLAHRYNFNKVIITASSDEVAYMRRFCPYEIVSGGASRQESLQNALKLVDSEFVAVSDAARFSLDFIVLDRLFSHDLGKIDCLIPTLGISDTIFLDDKIKKYLQREKIRLVQTPQISRVSVLREALKCGEFSDESSAINAYGGKVESIKGSKKLSKLTYFEDLADFGEFSTEQGTSENLKNQNNEILVGYGFDVHKFCKKNGRKLFLGGVEIPSDVAFEAHSDGDVLIHALCDAILGAIGAGDIGEWFPPSDESYKNADSKILLKKVLDFTRSVGFEIVNADIMIMAEKPKILPYKDQMSGILCEILGIQKYRLNIKATTMEKMGFIGRSEGVCVSAVVSAKYSLNKF